MKNLSTAPDTCRAIPVVLLGWLNNELRKLSQRSIREKEGSFTWMAQRMYMDLGQRIAVGNLFASRPDSKYHYAARELCEAAARGEEIVLKLPATQSKSVFLGQPGEKLSLDVELYEVINYNGNFGLTFIHKIRDVDGNELVWFSQGKRIDEGVYHLTAKVHTKADKAHVEYYGTKQTRVTHCKFQPRRLVSGDNGGNDVSNAR